MLRRSALRHDRHKTVAAIVRWLVSGITTAAALAAAEPSAEPVQWLRYPAVSPDGATIAFAAHGRIWRVPAAGGEARPLTDADYFATHPVWSPDGSRLAFAAKRHGNLDVFLMPADGGRLTRLTYHSADDTPAAFSPDGERVYFTSARLGGAQTVLAGGYIHSDQLYTVPVIGGRNRLVIPTPALAAAPDAGGENLLYEDRPVYENDWRKGAISDGARDIWLFNLAQKTHRRLTDFRGEDRNPVWAPDGNGYYFLSERSGSFNVWRSGVQSGAKAEPVTTHRGAPVRFLSGARDGSLVYGLDGEIWRKPPGKAAPQRVAIRLPAAAAQSAAAKSDEPATEMAVSRDGRQVAFVAHGEVFVLSTETGAARRLTHTPAHERNVSFAPDGKSLFYISERGGDMDIYEATLGDTIAERKLVDAPGDVLYPKISPDGKRLAYLVDRSRIWVLDRAAGTTVEVLRTGYFYSYTDEDVSFEWSPDSRWLTATVGSVVTNQDIALLDASGKTPPLFVTRSGFVDRGPVFSPDGKAVLWASGRERLLQADSGKSQLDLYLAYLTRAGFDGKAEPDGDAWKPQAVGIEQRTKRLTPFSLAPLLYTLLPGNESLLVVDRAPGSKAAVRRFDVATGEVTELFSRPLADSYALDAANRQLFALAGSAVERTDLATGETRVFPIDTSVEVDARAEFAYWFDHFWRLMRAKFYEPTMHGRDWEALRARYSQFLPAISTWEDFAELMSEMAGDLNVSHTGCYYLKPAPLGDRTASLGLYFDDTYEGTGLRIAAVLPGGPADITGSRLRPGVIIQAMETEILDANTDVDQLLNGMADSAVLLLLQIPGAKQTEIETIVPITQEQAATLRNAQWVAERKALTDKLSGGRLGYVHVPTMDLETYKRVYGEVIGDYRTKKALVVDVRYNEGGYLHDQIMTLFSGEIVAGFTNRDNVLIGRIPASRWARPTALLQNASSYSDGSIFPHLYRRQKLGPVVGDRVPGTGTAAWWIAPMKGALKWGVPQLGARDYQSGWLENQEIAPDRLVRTDPAAIAAGRDPQLEAAIAELLKKLPAK